MNKPKFTLKITSNLSVETSFSHFNTPEAAVKDVLELAKEAGVKIKRIQVFAYREGDVAS